MNFKELTERYVAFWMGIENVIIRTTDAVNKRIELMSEKHTSATSGYLEWANSPYKHPFFTNGNRNS